MSKSKPETIHGSLTDLSHHDAAICMLVELTNIIIDELSDTDAVFPVELHFVKPNRHKYILETKSATNEPLALDSLFYSSEKTAYFDKRLDILQDCTRIKPFNQKWNKARLIIHDDQRYIFQYKFDRDIHAAYSVMQGQQELKHLDEETFKKIRTWEGLSNNHPRPWLSS
ncbi:hypothetical protein [Agarilytica rhodophyticola]|uniref:hypothetical protein n=1 Tax=Agarilytica rhodophyticola TaxID=1737490 RepID=UPI00131529EB|nr:hypothetical protein [Agarilytica rhodophyticola]